jgi:hypothetical protein
VGESERANLLANEEVMIVLLSGNTRKGKNRVREHGCEWNVIRTEQTVLFDNRPGPWLWVEPVASPNPKNASRWVHERFDVDFKVAIKP